MRVLLCSVLFGKLFYINTYTICTIIHTVTLRVAIRFTVNHCSTSHILMYNETYVFSFEPIELNVDISDSHIYCGRSFHYPDPRFDGPVHEREIKHPFERWFPEFQNIFPQHIRAPWLKYFNLYPVSHFEDPSEYHLQLSAQRRCAALIRNHVQNKGPIW